MQSYFYVAYLLLYRFDSENIAVKTSVKMDYQGDTNKTVHSQANHSYSAINDNHLNKELQINNDKEGKSDFKYNLLLLLHVLY